MAAALLPLSRLFEFPAQRFNGGAIIKSQNTSPTDGLNVELSQGVQDTAKRRV
jgi:hypothetical protein